MRERVATVVAELRALDADEAVARLALGPVDRALKTTVTLCPTCLAHVPGLVVEHGGRVFLDRCCPEHGRLRALIEGDAAWYHLSNKDRHGRRFGELPVHHIPAYAGGCGEGACGAGEGTDQSDNKTCTVLIEVTDACNLACRVCYSDAKGTRYLPLEDVRETVMRLLAQKGRLDSVQLTGGEAALHPRFWDLVAFLHALPGVGKVYLPTNGLLFAQEANAERAARHADKLMLLLQFDALDRAANQALRQAHPRAVREKVVAAMDRLGVPMQLTMTVAQDVNDREVGAIVDVGLAHSCVKVIALQPVTWSGRYDLPVDPLRRLTLSDLAKAVLEQANLRMRPEDFVPIPCSHPNCGWITVFLRRFGLVHNVVRYTDLDRVAEDVAYRTTMSTDEVRRALEGSTTDLFRRMVAALGGKLVRSTDLFSIAIKPFMDRYSYDQDRIASCCHHTTTTRGELVSFCEYNALGRASDPWDRLPRLPEPP